MFYRYLALGLLAILAMGCRDRPKSLTEAEIQSILGDDSAQVFTVVDDRVGLEGVDGVYLGQSEDAALEAMQAYCKRFVTLDGGFMRETSVFKGCNTPDHPVLYSFRVGFTTRASNRVFTIEVKRRNVPLEVVRARFTQLFAPLELDLPRRGALQMESKELNVFADWDDGLDGASHILVGLDDQAVEKLTSDAIE